MSLYLALRSMILPPGLPLIVAMLGLLIALHPRWRRLGVGLCALAIAGLWAVSTPLVAGQLVKLVGRTPALDLSQPVAAQAVVILAGGVRRYAPEYNDDAPGDITLSRLVYGARVARVTGLPVLITGGEYEARAMNAMLVEDFGITPRWIENQSRDTRDNAALSAPLLKADNVDTIVLVTSAMHTPRAAAQFRAQGFTVIAAPVSDYSPADSVDTRWLPSAGGLDDSYGALYELIGNLVRTIRD